MKILFVMPTHISYGGIESVAINLWRGLSARGHVVDIVCHGYDKGIFEDWLINQGANIYHIPVKGKDYLGMRHEFRILLENGQYDVVHAHMNATSGIYLEMAMQQGIQVLVSHSHASSMKVVTSNPMKMLINWLEKKRTKKYANVKIACSDMAGNWLYGKAKFNVVLNAVDIEKFAYSKDIRVKKRNELGIPLECFVVIGIGSMLPCKNQIFLVEIFNEIKKQNQNSMLVLVGDGPLREKLEKRIKELDLEDSIVLLGNRNDVNELLQLADVFLLPSISEGNPVSLAEAATAGLHCVVSSEVSKDILPYFPKGAIDYIPIVDRNKLEPDLKNEYLKKWAITALEQKERVCYTKEAPCLLNASVMAEQVENLYKTHI